ncbi:MAG: hypothetical protein ACJ8M1_00415 [Chthoniobacterales bacterium]
MTSHSQAFRADRKARASGRRRRKQIWILGIAAVVLALIAAKPVFHWFKSQRAAQLAGKAEVLAAAGKLNDAADNYRAALQLDPVSYPALQGAARLATRVARPEALDLWEQVVKTRRATPEDRQEYAQQLIQVGRPKAAAATIEALVKGAPTPKTFQIAARYCRAVGETTKAIQFARLAIKGSPNDPLARFELAQMLALSTDGGERTEARNILWELTRSDTPYRQPAIEALAAAPELADSERQKLLDLLSSARPNDIRSDLVAADLRLQLPGVDPERTYDDLVARWSKGSVTQVVSLARWLNLHQQSERVLALFPVEEALKNNQLLLVRLDALASLQRWNDIHNLLSGPNLTLDPSVLECFKARTAQEQNSSLDADMHWNHALSLASGDPLKLRFVADFAQKSRAFTIALKAYEQLTKFPEHAAFAYRAIEHLSADPNDSSIQRAAAEKVVAMAGSDPNAAAQLAYVNLLANKDVQANTATAIRLSHEHPDRLSFRVAAALGCLRQHDPGLALDQFKAPAGAPPIAWDKTPPGWRAVYAAVLLANEQREAADQLIKNIPPNQLSVEERALIAER